MSNPRTSPKIRTLTELVKALIEDSEQNQVKVEGPTAAELRHAEEHLEIRDGEYVKPKKQPVVSPTAAQNFKKYFSDPNNHYVPCYAAQWQPKSVHLQRTVSAPVEPTATAPAFTRSQSAK